jgi:hypothetical protein
LWPLEIAADLLESVEWAASHPSYNQAHKGAHNWSKEKADAIRPANLRVAGSFCDTEQ